MKLFGISTLASLTVAVQLAVQERVTDLKEFLSGIPTHGCEKQEGGTQYADRFIIGQSYIRNRRCIALKISHPTTLAPPA